MILVHFWWLITSATNWFYGIVSGWGADLGLIAGIIIFYRRNNCHVKGCPRLGKHHIANGKYVVCSVHHPSVSKHPSHLDIIRAHKEHNSYER